MNDHPKYIIVQDEGHDQAVVFSPIMSHKQMAGGLKVVAAGFCSFDGAGNVSVWGESVTLQVKSRLQDYEIIRKQFNLI